VDEHMLEAPRRGSQQMGDARGGSGALCLACARRRSAFCHRLRSRFWRPIQRTVSESPFRHQRSMNWS